MILSTYPVREIGEWRALLTVATTWAALLLGCTIDLSPDTEKPGPAPVVAPRPIHGMNFFPFQDTTNRWWFTDAGSPAKISISDTGTVTDSEDVIDYKLVFHRGDSSDTILFRKKIPTRIPEIQCDTSLKGTGFKTFLPDSFSDIAGSFLTYADTVRYHFYDSLTLAEKKFRRVMDLHYQIPLVRRVNRLVFADSVGIVAIGDSTDVVNLLYVLDSAHVGGVVKSYRPLSP